MTSVTSVGGRRFVAARVTALLAMVSGLALIVAIFAARTFDRADAGEQATDLVRDELEPAGLAQHRADLELVRRTLLDMDDAFGAFAAELGTTTEAFERRIAAEHPDVAPILDRQARQEGLEFAEAIVRNLEDHQGDFEEADAIPVPWLPMTAGPWIGIVVALGLVAAGTWGLVRPGAGPAATAGALALLAVIGPLAVRFPQKADAADDLLDTLNVTPAIAARTRELLEGARAAVDRLEAEVYPAVSAALGMSDADFDAAVEQRFPDLARGRAELDGVFSRYEVRVQIREAGLDIVPVAKRFPLQAVTWWSVVPGTIVAASAAVALSPRASLVTARRRPGNGPRR